MDQDAARGVRAALEGWSHFGEGRAAIERELADVDDVRERVRWLPIGARTALAV